VREAALVDRASPWPGAARRIALARRALPLLLIAGMTLTALPAAAQEPPTPPPSSAPAEPPPPREAPHDSPALSDEDREVVENLELLESLDAAEDLELLIELSQED
jgi:hypothetical protein